MRSNLYILALTALLAYSAAAQQTGNHRAATANSESSPGHEAPLVFNSQMALFDPDEFA